MNLKTRTGVALATLTLAAFAHAQMDGMGPGMMGRGSWGHGPLSHERSEACSHPGAMGIGWDMGAGFGPRGEQGLGLSSEQRTKIRDIQRELGRKQWELMGKMHEQSWRTNEWYRDGKLDEAAARKAYDAEAELRKQMFEYGLDARRRVDSVLTPQQREQGQRAWSQP